MNEKVTAPTQEYIEKAVHKYLQDPRWAAAENYRRKLLKMWPNNSDIDQIAGKVAIVDHLFQAGLTGHPRMHLYSVATHIMTLNFDNRLSETDTNLVDDLADVAEPGRLFSLASKYCAFHSPDRYVVYDSRVIKHLKRFRDAFQFASFSDKELDAGCIAYNRFKEIIDGYVRFFGLERLELWQLDRFMWHEDLLFDAANRPRKMRRSNQV